MATKKTTSYNRKSVLKRRRKKNKNTLLYIAVLLLIAMISVGVIIACIIVENGGFDNSSDVSDASKDNSATSYDENSLKDSLITDVSYISEEPDESVGDISDVSDVSDVSDISDVSDEPDESDTTDVSSDNELDQSSKTKAYEDYIGIEYAIDMTKYEQYVDPDNASDFLFLVNPDNPLSKDFVPADLVKCTNIREGRPAEWSKMDRTANYALEAFLLEAKHYGFDDITVTNAYRSYASQNSLFTNYVASDLKSDYYCDKCDEYIDVSYEKSKVKNGKCAICGEKLRRPTKDETTAHVLTYSTRAGTSEHQSGLCCDMHNLPATTSAFDNTPEAKWLAQNAHRFGFILRYPEGKQHITGIKHESWHFRYVGRDAATEMFERGLTLDEYLG